MPTCPPPASVPGCSRASPGSESACQSCGGCGGCGSAPAGDARRPTPDAVTTPTLRWPAPSGSQHQHQQHHHHHHRHHRHHHRPHSCCVAAWPRARACAPAPRVLSPVTGWSRGMRGASAVACAWKLAVGAAVTLRWSVCSATLTATRWCRGLTRHPTPVYGAWRQPWQTVSRCLALALGAGSVALAHSCSRHRTEDQKLQTRWRAAAHHQRCLHQHCHAGGPLDDPPAMVHQLQRQPHRASAW